MVINAGNSRLAMGAVVAGELRDVKRIDIRQQADWTASIAQAWASLSGS